MDSPVAVFTDADQDPATGALDGREAYFYHTNPRGYVHAISDESGVIQKRYDYSFYGKVRELSASNVPTSILIVPSGSETTVVVGQSYNFTLQATNTDQDGTFELFFESTTGTASYSAATYSFEASTFEPNTLLLKNT